MDQKNYVFHAFTDSKGNLNPTKRISNEIKEKILLEFPQFNTIGEVLWGCLNDRMTRPLCEVCNINPVLFISPFKGFKKTCSKLCASRHPDRAIKTKATILKRYNGVHYSSTPEHKQLLLDRHGKIPGSFGTVEHKNAIIKKYGVDNVFKSNVIKQKIKDANLEKYGVSNPQQNDEIKRRTEKTNLERYGHGSPLANKEIQEKIKDTNLEKYGVSNPQQNNEIRQRTEETLENRHGGIGWGSISIRDKYKETMLERYQVTSPLKSPLIIERVLSTYLESFKKNRLPDRLSRIAERDSIPLYEISEFKGCSYQHKYKHSCGHVYESNLEDGKIPKCPVCFTASKPHQMLIDEIVRRAPNINMVVNCRSVIAPLELDLYFPDHRLAVEVNGIYWHRDSDLTKKLDLCNDKEYSPFQLNLD